MCGLCWGCVGAIYFCDWWQPISPRPFQRAWPSSSSIALSRRNVYRQIQRSANCQFTVLLKGASRRFRSRATMQRFQTNVTSFKKVRNLLVFIHLLLFKTNSFIHKCMWHAWGLKRATLHLLTRQLDGQAITGKSSLSKLLIRAADFSFENCAETEQGQTCGFISAHLIQSKAYCNSHSYEDFLWKKG